MIKMTVVLPSGKTLAYRVPSVDFVEHQVATLAKGTRVLVHIDSNLVSDTTV